MIDHESKWFIINHWLLNYSLEKWLSVFNHIVVVVACLSLSTYNPIFQRSLYLTPNPVCVLVRFSQKFRIIFAKSIHHIESKIWNSIFGFIDLEDQTTHRDEPGLEPIGRSPPLMMANLYYSFARQELPSPSRLLFGAKTTIIILHN